MLTIMTMKGTLDELPPTTPKRANAPSINQSGSTHTVSAISPRLERLATPRASSSHSRSKYYRNSSSNFSKTLKSLSPKKLASKVRKKKKKDPRTSFGSSSEVKQLKKALDEAAKRRQTLSPEQQRLEPCHLDDGIEERLDHYTTRDRADSASFSRAGSFNEFVFRLGNEIDTKLDEIFTTPRGSSTTSTSEIRNDELIADNARLKSELETAHNDNSGLESELATAHGVNSMLNTELETTQSANDKLKSELEAANSKLKAELEMQETRNVCQLLETEEEGHQLTAYETWSDFCKRFREMLRGGRKSNSTSRLDSRGSARVSALLDELSFRTS